MRCLVCVSLISLSQSSKRQEPSSRTSAFKTYFCPGRSFATISVGFGAETFRGIFFGIYHCSIYVTNLERGCRLKHEQAPLLIRGGALLALHGLYFYCGVAPAMTKTPVAGVEVLFGGGVDLIDRDGAAASPAVNNRPTYLMLPMPTISFPPGPLWCMSMYREGYRYPVPMSGFAWHGRNGHVVDFVQVAEKPFCRRSAKGIPQV